MLPPRHVQNLGIWSGVDFLDHPSDLPHTVSADCPSIHAVRHFPVTLPLCGHPLTLPVAELAGRRLADQGDKRKATPLKWDGCSPSLMPTCKGGYQSEEDFGKKCQRWVVTRDSAWRCEHDGCNIAVFKRTLLSILHSQSRKNSLFGRKNRMVQPDSLNVD